MPALANRSAPGVHQDFDLLRSGVASTSDAGIDLRKTIEEYESSLIRQALARTGGNKHRAAQLLGLNRTTLVEMVKRKKIAA